MIRVSDATFDALRLSPREREVALLILEGKRIDGIAAELFNSSETIKTHLKRIRGKTGTRDMAGIVCALWRMEQDSGAVATGRR